MPFRIAAPPPTGQERTRLASFIVAMCLVILLPACREGDSGPATYPLSPELQAVMAGLSEQRGLPAATNIRAGLVRRDDVRSVVGDALSDSDRQAFAHLTSLYRLLGHLGPGEDYEDLYLDFVADALVGLYLPLTDEFLVVDDGESIDFAALSALQRSIVAHEFVHALQDSAFDVPKLFEAAGDELDWTLALTAVIEGDAVLHEGLWTRGHAQQVGAGRAWLGAQAPRAAVPPSVEREWRFPYEAGTEWVSVVRASGGQQAVDTVLRGRRITTAEILHPELFASGWKRADVALPDLAHGLGSGWKHESGGSFGEFNLRNLLQLHLPGLVSVTACAGWAGDRYDVYRSGSESVAAIRVAFSSAGESAEFVAAIDQWLDAAGGVRGAAGQPLYSLRDGRGLAVTSPAANEVLLVFGTTPSTAGKALQLLGGS
ncbi:hypothetical protein [Candidatus Amarobacter glycogenicus]|uniref:hypothetical protein n=1 Tax=Candidatus Amarobacter glycogenicus TaxID=3140699 RepID=UPI003137455C|nr:hypothetical protein [Dehalococcoidia bacterium]